MVLGCINSLLYFFTDEIILKITTRSLKKQVNLYEYQKSWKTNVSSMDGSVHVVFTIDYQRKIYNSYLKESKEPEIFYCSTVFDCLNT